MEMWWCPDYLFTVEESASARVLRVAFPTHSNSVWDTTTHLQFSVWYLVPHPLSLEFQRVCGTLEIQVCGTVI